MALESKRDSIQAAQDREQSAREYLYSALVIGVLALIAVIIDDTMIPFFSLCFVFGIIATFGFSIGYSSETALVTGFGVLGVMFMAHLGREPEIFILFVWELPFFAVFFVGLAYLPNLVPQIIRDNVERQQIECASWDAKVAELDAVLKSEQDHVIEEKSSKVKQEVARYSSRNALMTQFSRSTMQAGSSREVLNLLFHSLTKTFGVEECILLINRLDQEEIVITRALHPEYEKFENTKHNKMEMTILRKLFDNKCLMHFDPPELLVPGLKTELVFPVFVEGEIHGIFCLAKTRSGRLTKEDVGFIDTLSTITSGAIEQIQIATSTS